MLMWQILRSQKTPNPYKQTGALFFPAALSETRSLEQGQAIHGLNSSSLFELSSATFNWVCCEAVDTNGENNCQTGIEIGNMVVYFHVTSPCWHGDYMEESTIWHDHKNSEHLYVFSFSDICFFLKQFLRFLNSFGGGVCMWKSSFIVNFSFFTFGMV